MSKHHVLFVGNDAFYFRSHRLDLAQALIRQGYRVSAVLPRMFRSSAISDISDAGVFVFGYPFSRGGMNPITEFCVLAELWRLYRRLAPDAVHHLTVKPVLYGGIVGRLVGVPVRIHALLGLGYLFFSDDLKARVARLLLRPAFRFALGGQGSQVLVQNPDDLEVLRRNRLLSPEALERARIIPGSGVDPGRFDVHAKPASPPIVLFAGRLTSAKGVQDFVEAVRMLRQAGNATRYVICGSVDRSNPGHVTEDQIRSWVEEGMVEWWGHQSDMRGVLGEASVVVLPSLYGEGIPKILIEAAAAGRAIVTTNTPGCREIVRDGENGLLVAAGDADALAAAIRRLIEEPDTRSRMGVAGRRRVEEGFSLERVIEQTLEVYSEMLGRT